MIHRPEARPHRQPRTTLSAQNTIAPLISGDSETLNAALRTEAKAGELFGLANAPFRAEGGNDVQSY